MFPGSELLRRVPAGARTGRLSSPPLPNHVVRRVRQRRRSRSIFCEFLKTVCVCNSDLLPSFPRGLAPHCRLSDVRGRSRIAPAERAIEIGKIAEPDAERDRADAAVGKARVAQ